MLDFLLQGLVLGAAAAAQPGPLQAYLVQRTVEQGTARALPGVLAPLVSDGPVVVVILVLLSGVPGWSLSLLHIGGGLYLLWLAFRAGVRPDVATRDRGLHAGLLRAVLVNVLAPGPYLFWGLVGGPMVLEAARQSVAAASSFVVAFYLAMITVNAGLVVGFGWASSRGERLRVALRVTSVVALGAFGLWSIGNGLCTVGGQERTGSRRCPASRGGPWAAFAAADSAGTCRWEGGVVSRAVA
ncbi:MAG: LysE family transporter [Polyangiaceae bacterium]|nr:LysE family transporter [Polyangiaceae bacterium]